MPISSRILSSMLAGGIAFSAGCYYADFDPDASGVFLCGGDEECPTGQQCFNGTCVADIGPALQVLGPEPFARVDAADTAQLTSFVMTVKGSDLSLTDGNQAVEGEGYIRVYIDGQDQFGRIFAGNIGQGLNTDPLDLSGLAVGPHRIRVRAFYGDDQPYQNPSASAESMFFIDDGTPQVAIVEPRPGHVQRPGSTMDVTLAAINWTWNSANSALADGEGHTHVYSLANYPDCLQFEETSDEYCNNFYLTSISGAGDPSNSILLHGEISADNMAQLAPGQSHPLQAGLQTNEHEPFPSPTSNEFDQISFELAAE